MLDALVPDVQSQIDDIRALEPPDEMADAVETFLDDAQATLDELNNRPPTTHRPSSRRTRIRSPRSTRQANEIGLTECADDGEEE